MSLQVQTFKYHVNYKLTISTPTTFCMQKFDVIWAILILFSNSGKILAINFVYLIYVLSSRKFVHVFQRSRGKEVDILHWKSLFSYRICDATPRGANLFGRRMNSNRNDRHFCLQWRFARWQECFNYVARWQRRGWDQVNAVIHMHFDCIRQTSGTNSTSWLRCHKPPYLLPLPLPLFLVCLCIVLLESELFDTDSGRT